MDTPAAPSPLLSTLRRTPASPHPSVSPTGVSRHWLLTRDGDRRALALYERHYSCRPLPKGRPRRLFVGPGQKTVLVTRRGDAVLAWRKFLDDSGQSGVNCAVFRNEGLVLSSLLLREAMGVAWERWPGARLYTYVDARRVRSVNPGYCFVKAGWRRCGRTRRGLLILEVWPEGATGSQYNQSIKSRVNCCSGRQDKKSPPPWCGERAKGVEGSFRGS